MVFKFNYFTISLIIIIIVDKFENINKLHSAIKDHPRLFTLNIAILSARENFDKRQAIRNSWFKLIDHMNKIVTINPITPFKINAHFILGDKSCPIYPQNRENLYDCQFRNVSTKLSVLNRTNSIFKSKVIETKQGLINKIWYKGFSFQNFYETTIKRIYVLASLVEHLKRVKIVIFNAFTKNKIFETEVTNKNQFDGIFHHVDISINLNPLTYIVIIDELFSYQINASFHIKYSDLGGIIKIIRSYYGHSDYDSEAFDETNDLFMVNLDYKINGGQESISKRLKVDEYNSYLWTKKMQKLNQNLLKESETFGDILFVELIDVYRNLPEKLLQYFDRYINENKMVTHFLKTDDDCYLNIKSVISLLLKHFKRKHSWFGNFRKKWLINYYGKWADQQYSSTIYPQFACGSGYILTRDLVDFLILNRKQLRRYQGEDISMGIWLAAIDPKRIQDRRWLCGDESQFDEQHFLSAAQLTPETMARLYSTLNDEHHTFDTID